MTELITGDLEPWTRDSNVSGQKCRMKLRMEKEKVFQKDAATIYAEKALIVCDCGMLDNKVCMTDQELSGVLSALVCNEAETREQYDATLHLATAARETERFYTTANNADRTETVEQAVCAG